MKKVLLIVLMLSSSPVLQAKRLTQLDHSQEKVAELSASDIAIEFIGHAAFRLHFPDFKLLIDPFKSGGWPGGVRFPKEVDADLVLVTHDHDDHNGGSGSGRGRWKDTPFTNKAQRLELGPLIIRGIKSRHVRGYGYNGTHTLWLIEYADMRILHVGDTGPLSDKAMAKIGPVDILMLPADDKGHILTTKSINKMLSKLAPHIVIPMHYWSFPSGGPNDLGGIEKILSKQHRVTQLKHHIKHFNKDMLKDVPTTFMTFQHWPGLRYD
jgi:L-ascorbate metabolism protein UlaG (beta-lactamase superfamily)